jgi:hypothetical protein
MANEPDDIDREAGKPVEASADNSADHPPRTGYKNTPVHTRFHKGQSGNRKGRPKGSGSPRALFERLMRETVRVRDGKRLRRITTSDALAQVLLRGTMQGEPGAVNVQMYIEDKAGLLNIPDESDTRTGHYLVLPHPAKLPPEEWDKAAKRALEAVMEPDTEQKPSLPYVPPGYKLCRSVATGEPIVRPIT